MWLTQERLWALRCQISLNSLYYSDYINTFGIDCHLVCDFFDSFLNFIEEQMVQDIPKYDDSHFFDYLPAYDNAEQLWNWYSCYEENPMPFPELEEAETAA